MNVNLPLSEKQNAIIASLPLFKGLEAALVSELLAVGHIENHGKGSFFLKQGQPMTYFYVVLEGWCGLSKSNEEGQEALLQIFRKDDLFPELQPQPLMMMKSPFNIQALTPLSLFAIPHSFLHNMLSASQVFTSTILSLAVQRCQDLRDRVEQLTLCDAEQRMGRFLLQLRLWGDQKSSEIILPFNKALIASYLGIKPETFSRVLLAFKEKGFVVDRSHVVTPVHDSLCGFCDSTLVHACDHADPHTCPVLLAEK